MKSRVGRRRGGKNRLVEALGDRFERDGHLLGLGARRQTQSQGHHDTAKIPHSTLHLPDGRRYGAVRGSGNRGALNHE